MRCHGEDDCLSWILGTWVIVMDGWVRCSDEVEERVETV